MYGLAESKLVDELKTGVWISSPDWFVLWVFTTLVSTVLQEGKLDKSKLFDS